MNKILIFLGYSGCGKTTILRYLEKKGYYHFHPYNFRKQEIESLHNLPKGFLNTEAKLTFIPMGMNMTLQQQMVEEYHFFKRVDPYFTTRNIQREISPILGVQGLLAMNGIRQTQEAKEIINLCTRYSVGYTLIYVDREANRAENSDEKLLEIQQILKEAPTCLRYEILDNNGSLEELYSKVDKLCYV